MAVRNDFTAGEVLAAADLNDTFASKPTFTYGTATPTADADGAIWYDENDTPPTPKFWDGSAWQPFSTGVAAAVISDTPTGNYTDGSGQSWDYWEFTSGGTLTCTTEGEAEVLVVGGGGGAGSNSGRVGGGGAGQLIGKNITMTAATHTVTIGAGGTTGNPVGNQGGKTSLGSLVSAGGGGAGLGTVNNSSNIFPSWSHAGGHAGGIIIFSSSAGRNGMGTNAAGANEYSGTSSDITGSSVTYGEGGNSGAPTTLGSGGWSSTNGAAGVVVVRVKV